MTVLDVHLYSHRCVSATKKTFTTVKQVCVIMAIQCWNADKHGPPNKHRQQFWYFTLKLTENRPIRPD